jgi:cell division protein FtsL
MKLVKLLSVVIALLVVTSVTFSNHSLDDSQKVADLSAEISAIEKQNTLTAAKIAEEGSLTKIAGRVDAMGFVQPAKVVSLTLPGNVASR